jgi:toxin-antitoxin system PIN domain toxin
MKPSLLDVNVLIALLDPEHVFHDAAHVWFEQNRRHGWATCPLTENGCVRILSKAAFAYSGVTPSKLRQLLAQFTRDKRHAFWPDSVTLLDSGTFDLEGAGPTNLTDLYLLGLAHANGGRLATFDRKIRWQAVAGCTPAALAIL